MDQRETTRNVTLKVDASLLETARMLAAARGQSVSDLFDSLVRKVIAGDAAFRSRRKRFRDRMEKGFDLGSGGKAPLTRAARHER
jgi:hypothetical protein